MTRGHVLTLRLWRALEKLQKDKRREVYVRWCAWANITVAFSAKNIDIPFGGV